MADAPPMDVDALRIGPNALQQFDIISLSSDPTIGLGHNAVLFTVGVDISNGNFYTKIGIADTAWSGGNLPGSAGGGGGSSSLNILLTDGITNCSVSIPSGTLNILLSDGITNCGVSV